MTSKLTIEQARRLRNDFECWQQDYDPKDDKEQFDMFGRGMAAMDMLIAVMYQEPVAYMYRDNLHSDARFSLESKIGNWSSEDINEHEIREIPLYRHAQQPVVSDGNFYTETQKKLLLEAANVLVTRKPTATHGYLIREVGRIAIRALARPQPAPVVDADDNFYSWFGREWQENYQHNQYTTAAKQMLGMMAESAWKAGRRAAMLQGAENAESRCGNSPVIPGWIPVSEQLPEECGRYWCYVEEQNSLGKSHYQWNCSWNGEIWGGAMMYGRVTHWMPLPAAPQEVK